MSRLPVIPYYRVTRLIQEGGTSAVYQGIDLRSGNIVAIKALFSNKAKDEFILERFREEANHYLLLTHPNIPKLVDFVVDEGRMYLIMEYIEGVDMSKYLQTNGPLDENMMIHFFSMILDTIGYLHSQGILHLDIKPSNIMVTEDFGIKILDLGISAMASEGETRKKKCGSPSFMAPEQVKGEKLGYYTDIYQIGVTLFNMITGELPYNGSSQKEIFDNIQNQSIPSLKDYQTLVDEGMQDIIEKALQKEGSDRYASCEEFLNAMMDGQPVSEECSKAPDKKAEVQTKIQEQEENRKNSMKIITVGREIGNDVVISDSYVGRYHLELIKDDIGTFFIRDLNSTNGTFVNGQRITGEVILEKNDVVRIGNTTIPWISYFENQQETEIEEEKPKKRNSSRKRESQSGGSEKFKKIMTQVGKWLGRTLLAIGTSILMMMIYRKLMGR